MSLILMLWNVFVVEIGLFGIRYDVLYLLCILLVINLERKLLVMLLKLFKVKLLLIVVSDWNVFFVVKGLSCMFLFFEYLDEKL